MTIRRFPRSYSLDELVDGGSLDRPTAGLLTALVASRVSLVVSGGTGSGKTTMLNALSSFIPEGERVVTIEQTAELQLDKAHVIRLESRPPNVEGTGEVTISDLVRNALRMRPDRIVVGEVRGGETLDMLQAMNTGHEGSLTTVHANTAEDALLRLVTLASMTELELPFATLQEQVNSAVEVVVQLERAVDGTRRLVEVSALASGRREAFRLVPLVRLEDGEHRHGPLPPALARRVVAAGRQVPPVFASRVAG
jgi:pilus assembly protein CpaF